MEQIITDLGNWNTIKKYNILDLQKFINTGNPILSVQKSIIKNWLDKILLWAWIENIDKTVLEENMGRAWFFSIESEEFWEMGFLWTKWSDSTKSFSEISDYYLWWTDIWDKVQARWLNLEQIEKVLWEVLWWYKTELLLLLWRKTLEQIGDISNFELDILTTKFTPTLTKKVIEQLPKLMKKPIINTVDSNSELNIQIQEILNPKKNIWAIEIVQSWNSLIATDSFVVKDWKIFEPSVRNKESWEFEWNIIWEIDPKSQAWIVANWIQSQVDLALYNIVSNKNNKPTEFIKAIQNSMKQF